MLGHYSLLFMRTAGQWRGRAVKQQGENILRWGSQSEGGDEVFWEKGDETSRVVVHQIQSFCEGLSALTWKLYIPHQLQIWC